MYRTADTAGYACLDYEDGLASVARAQPGRALNGHVPITAIVSLIVVAAGYVYGYDTTLMALEARPMRQPHSSATSLSTTVEQEHRVRARAAVGHRESVCGAVEYSSPLRSCGEIEIARWFAICPLTTPVH